MDPLSDFLRSFPHRIEVGAVENSISRGLPGLIVSGGQTGTDRAAFDVALTLDIPCAGFVPRGSIDENGPIPALYRPHVLEPSTPFEIKDALDVFAERTELNVIYSQGTLILSPGEPIGGTLLTVEFANRHKRPCLLIDLDGVRADSAAFVAWRRARGIDVLNVAGPRESLRPGDIYKRSKELLWELFRREML